MLSFVIFLLSPVKFFSCPIITLYALAWEEKKSQKIGTELRKLPTRPSRKGKIGMVQMAQWWEFMAKLWWDGSAGSPGKLRYIWRGGEGCVCVCRDFGMVRCSRICSVHINRLSVLHLSLSQTNYSFSAKKTRKIVCKMAKEIPEYLLTLWLQE